ncbi:glycosyltransferase [Marinobacter sp. MA]|jgi:glycosyltransferase involved in cell wall biosynthesis|uniref:glycosyltransferase n=1 Tax=Marinobacter sp. MA TaxID=2971606 RepID=UPI003AAE72B0
MKVLHVTFNMAIGGTEQVIRQLIEGIDNSDVDCEVLCIDGFVGPIGQQLVEKGVAVNSLQRKPGIDFGLVANLRAVIRQGDYDIVHCHQYTPWFYGWLASLGTRARVVFTEHGRFHPDRYRYKAFLINPVMATLTARIIAISNATAEALNRYEFIPGKQISVIYNGIRGMVRDSRKVAGLKKELGLADGELVFGTVSRLDSVKNQRMMIKAFARFLEGSGPAKLLIVGDGPERSSLESLVAELGLSGSVRFTGFITRPEHHLACLDVFLLSSHTEGTSMTLLEAMSLGIPQIATRVGGNPEIVEDGVTGLLTASDDANEFANAMKRLQQQPDMRSHMGAASLSRFEQSFTVSAMVNNYLKVYCAIAERERIRV